MTPMLADDVSHWVNNVRSGDEESATQLWDCCFGQMVNLARRWLGTRHPSVDAEDVALSAFHVACHGLAQGRFEALRHRDEFWALLVTLLRRKIRQHKRELGCQKRGGDRLRIDFDTEDLPSGSCDGGELATGALALQELLGSLPEESLALVAIWKLEGYTNGEIGERLDVSSATVKRKLSIIRDCWTAHLE